MSSSPNDDGLATNTCDACAGLSPSTPLAQENRPGLSAVAYRTGKHGDFLASMVAGLSRADRPALAALRTRSTDDFTVALLDAWASTLDVVTFYQERIANEAYLRTATERLSLVHMARALGYELAPAVAAGTVLAFTLETASGAPETVRIPKGTRVQSLPGQDGLPQTFETSAAFEARGIWNEMRTQRLTAPTLENATSVDVKGLRTDLRLGDGVVFFKKNHASPPAAGEWHFAKLTAIVPNAAAGTTTLRWSPKVPFGSDTVHVLHRRAAIFGAYAVDFNMLAKDVKAAYLKQSNDSTAPENATIWPKFTMSSIVNNTTLALDTVYPNVVVDGWLVLEAPSNADGTLSFILHAVTAPVVRSITKFGLSGQATTLPVPATTLTTLDSHIRTTSVYCESERLDLAPVGKTDAVGRAGAKKEIVLDKRVTGLAPGRLLLISGKDAAGASVSETIVLEKSDDDGTRTTLRLQSDLVYMYQPNEAVVFGNVVEATQGETVPTETLGNGNAAAAHQKFMLRQTPLTHISASNPRGFASTLQVRVDDVVWKEVDRLANAGPRDRVFVTRIDNDDKTQIIFGDGRTGARVPTGSENIRADYRKTAGSAGNVAKDRISLMLTRPPGVRSVTNPIAATDGVDRETIDDVRLRAPLSVTTLDRVVSLEDYASFARSFHGIAKARATWVWDRDRRAVLLTVAGVGGSVIDPGSQLEKKLRAALANATDPHVPVHIGTFTKVLFSVQLNIKVQTDPGFLPARVLKDVRSALCSAFSFERRDFGQNLAKSEIVAVAARVPGVAWVDFDGFSRPLLQPIGIEGSYLPCRAPRDGDDAATAMANPAEMLCIDLAEPTSSSTVIAL